MPETDRLALDPTHMADKLQSKMNHECAPSGKVVCSFTDSTIDIVATREIQRGEELTLSYVDPKLDKAQRRRMLRDCYGFECKCKECTRCMD